MLIRKMNGTLTHNVLRITDVANLKINIKRLNKTCYENRT